MAAHGVADQSPTLPIRKGAVVCMDIANNIVSYKIFKNHPLADKEYIEPL
jgi:hypothetical protein